MLRSHFSNKEKQKLHHLHCWSKSSMGSTSWPRWNHSSRCEPCTSTILWPKLWSRDWPSRDKKNGEIMYVEARWADINIVRSDSLFVMIFWFRVWMLRVYVSIPLARDVLSWCIISFQVWNHLWLWAWTNHLMTFESKRECLLLNGNDIHTSSLTRLVTNRSAEAWKKAGKFYNLMACCEVPFDAYSCHDVES